MRYYQPYGEADPNAPYKDRNTGAGSAGSKVPAKAIEHPQREIMTVIESAGLTPDEGSVSQLNEAIDLKIDQALGSGANPLNDLLAILRARNPIFPTINSVGNTFNLSQPSAGVVRIPAGISITHRGCFNETTTEQDFTTVANKTYHLRKRWTGGSPGWALVDVLETGYNPSALPEADPAFDTTFDDMISHRVVTDPSNVPTITALANRDRLFASFAKTSFEQQGGGTWSGLPTLTAPINWARTPRQLSVPACSVDTTVQNKAMVSHQATATRYALAAHAFGYILASGWATPYVSGAITVHLEA